VYVDVYVWVMYSRESRTIRWSIILLTMLFLCVLISLYSQWIPGTEGVN
jgi:hypothetical protein